MGQDARIDTLAVHVGSGGDNTVECLSTPICQTAAFKFHSTEHAANLFMLKEEGNIYTRMGNPTMENFEKRMNALDGGVGAVATASGMTAISYVIFNICKHGDNIVSSPNLYGGVRNLFANILPNLGIEVRFVEHDDPENFRRAADDKTRCFFGETLPNPKLNVFPISEVAAIGDEMGIPLCIDNTCATPVLCRPFDHGAHLAVYSTTKYICGHGSSIGGIIIDSGNFNWKEHKKRFPLLNEPDPSYHGLVWTEHFKKDAFINKLRATILRDLGGCMAPMNAFLFSHGMKTLSLRMERHCQNALQVAKFLNDHPKVSRISYPFFAEGNSKKWAEKYLGGHYGAMIGAEIDGGLEPAKQFVESLQFFYHVANIGDVRSLVIHPASTTHSQVPKEVRFEGGITDGYVRLCVGIENIDDIIGDLEQALERLPSYASQK